jgi:hypothetical protein
MHPPDKEDEEEGSDGEDTPEDSGDNEVLCHKCTKPGTLVCCGECPHAWHANCLPWDAMPLDSDLWLCPVCAGSDAPVGFVGLPQQPPHRGSRHRSRKRPAAEGTKQQVAASKRARRGQQGPRFR